MIFSRNALIKWDWNRNYSARDPFSKPNFCFFIWLFLREKWLKRKATISNVIFFFFSLKVDSPHPPHPLCDYIMYSYGASKKAFSQVLSYQIWFYISTCMNIWSLLWGLRVKFSCENDIELWYWLTAILKIIRLLPPHPPPPPPVIFKVSVSIFTLMENDTTQNFLVWSHFVFTWWHFQKDSTPRVQTRLLEHGVVYWNCSSVVSSFEKR